MIKKLFFASALLSCFAVSNAQVQIWQDNFNDEDISDWTLYDDDGDGNNWGDLFQIQNQAGVPVTPVSLISRSWQANVALTPDNWAISPAINIAGAGGTLTVSWITQVAAQSWDEEHYAVYVSTSPDQESFLASNYVLEETLGQGTNAGTPVNHTLDISSLIGEPQIYIAIRHFDSQDQDFISVDDVTVTASTLAVSDVSKTSVSVYPNPTSDFLNLKSADKVLSTEVYDIVGKKISGLKFVDGQLNVQELAKGTYVVKVVSEKGTTSHKFIKK